MEIKRNIHLNRIIARKGNGMIKVITGMRLPPSPQSADHPAYRKRH